MFARDFNTNVRVYVLLGVFLNTWLLNLYLKPESDCISSLTGFKYTLYEVYLIQYIGIQKISSNTFRVNTTL